MAGHLRLLFADSSTHSSAAPMITPFFAGGTRAGGDVIAAGES
jgi:hypothetical protein